jgi:putative ABC transport system substrate-binding protein
VKRRDTIALLGGAAVWPLSWSLAARAQRAERMRLIGLVAGAGEPEMRPLLAAFRERLKQLGWEDGRNLAIDVRLGGGDLKRMTDDTAGLVARNPDVILAQGTPGLTAVRRYSRTVPVVFVLVADPVKMGLIESLARPGGHATGFTNFEFAIGGKWLELLREVDRRVRRVTLIANPGNPNAGPFSQFIENAGRSVSVAVTTAPVHNAGEIESAIAAAAQQPGSGLIVFPDSLTLVHRATIIGQAARHRLPAVYPFRVFTAGGGLMSYGLDMPEVYRQAAGYVDRILRGARPADLPVQAPNQFELVINLKTAKALGLEVPLHLQQRADEVIE